MCWTSSSLVDPGHLELEVLPQSLESGLYPCSLFGNGAGKDEGEKVSLEFISEELHGWIKLTM